MMEVCKCITSYFNHANVSTIVQNVMTSKKVSKHFDSKNTDAMESVTETENLKLELGDA